MRNALFALCALFLAPAIVAQGNPDTFDVTPGDTLRIVLVAEHEPLEIYMAQANDYWPADELEILSISNGYAPGHPLYKGWSQIVWAPQPPFSHRQFNISVPHGWVGQYMVVTSTLTPDVYEFFVI